MLQSADVGLRQETDQTLEEQFRERENRLQARVLKLASDNTEMQFELEIVKKDVPRLKVDAVCSEFMCYVWTCCVNILLHFLQSHFRTFSWPGTCWTPAAIHRFVAIRETRPWAKVREDKVAVATQSRFLLRSFTAEARVDCWRSVSRAFVINLITWSIQSDLCSGNCIARLSCSVVLVLSSRWTRCVLRKFFQLLREAALIVALQTPDLQNETQQMRFDYY